MWSAVIRAALPVMQSKFRMMRAHGTDSYRVALLSKLPWRGTPSMVVPSTLSPAATPRLGSVQLLKRVLSGELMLFLHQGLGAICLGPWVVRSICSSHVRGAVWWAEGHDAGNRLKCHATSEEMQSCRRRNKKFKSCGSCVLCLSVRCFVDWRIYFVIYMPCIKLSIVINYHQHLS